MGYFVLMHTFSKAFLFLILNNNHHDLIDFI